MSVDQNVSGLTMDKVDLCYCFHMFSSALSNYYLFRMNFGLNGCMLLLSLDLGGPFPLTSRTTYFMIVYLCFSWWRCIKFQVKAQACFVFIAHIVMTLKSTALTKVVYRYCVVVHINKIALNLCLLCFLIWVLFQFWTELPHIIHK